VGDWGLMIKFDGDGEIFPPSPQQIPAFLCEPLLRLFVAGIVFFEGVPKRFAVMRIAKVSQLVRHDIGDDALGRFHQIPVEVDVAQR